MKSAAAVEVIAVSVEQDTSRIAQDISAVVIVDVCCAREIGAVPKSRFNGFLRFAVQRSIYFETAGIYERSR